MRLVGDDLGLSTLSLEDRARLRAAHLRAVARNLRAGVATAPSPDLLETVARLLDGLADAADNTPTCGAARWFRRT